MSIILPANLQYRVRPKLASSFVSNWSKDAVKLEQEHHHTGKPTHIKSRKTEALRHA